MLGYKGRSDRREFITGTALLTVGPMAFSMLVKPSIPWAFSAFDRNIALAAAFVLTLVVCAVVVGWFWGWTVLGTRRARDAGLPAWAGVLSLVILVGVGRATAGLPAAFALVAGWAVALSWLAAFALLPSAKEDPGARGGQVLNPAP